MRITISGPPKSGRTSLGKALFERYKARGRAARFVDDNDGLDLYWPGAGPPAEIRTVRRPSEPGAQPGDWPAFAGEDAILATGPGGRVHVLRPGRAEALFAGCRDRELLADLVLIALGEPQAAAVAPPREDLFGDAWEGD